MLSLYKSMENPWNISTNDGGLHQYQSRKKKNALEKCDDGRTYSPPAGDV